MLQPCYSLQCIEAVVSSSNGATRLRGSVTLPSLLGYRNYYALHGSPYTSAHVLIENTLHIQHKMAKNSRMALCSQNRVSKGTNQCYGLHISSASISVHSASVMELGLLKKKKKKKKKKQYKTAF